LTKVHDYKLVSPWGLSALRNYYRDKWSLGAADFVVTDTAAHLEYFATKFKIPREKMGVLYIGNNFDEFHPTPGPMFKTGFLVGFYGGFIPLQGTMNILAAAELLKSHEDIRFELIGTGFEYKKAQKMVKDKGLTNVDLPGWVDAKELPSRISRFDIALGIFGETVKADLVIPNKLYHYGSCARAIITKDSPAIHEIFTVGEDLITIEPSPDLIAQKILELKANADMRQWLGQNIHKKLQDKYNETAVAKRLLEFSFAQYAL
jgi:glycosyltransferase involved in cell wall biosynthesis